jgi:hypothetical protein
VLNGTNPNVTKSCWLCLMSGPPYYEGMAVIGTYNNTTSHDHCSWGCSHTFTLTEVSGTGTCIGKVPLSHRHLCNVTYKSPQTELTYYLSPGPNKWWACSTGLTHCVSTSVFNDTRDYCILVQLVPRVIYHPSETFAYEFDRWPTRLHREPVTMTLAVLLGLGGIAAGIGTGAAALDRVTRYYSQLREVTDTNITALEQSIIRLKESLTSLSEVVLQNCRGLDLLFFKEGGLCPALKEECCFYVDHSGVIEDSMRKLRDRLEKRKRDREAQTGWFEGLFNKSPWLTTLISTLMGPLIILLLLLMCGPLILNKLVTFVRERIGAVQLLVLRQQYQSMQNLEEEIAV